MSTSNHSYLQGFWIFVYIYIYICQVLPEKGILYRNIPTNCTMLTYLKGEMIMNHSIFGISSLMGLIPFQLCDLDFSTEESSLWFSSAGNGSPSQTRVWKWNPWSILPTVFYLFLIGAMMMNPWIWGYTALFQDPEAWTGPEIQTRTQVGTRDPPLLALSRAWWNRLTGTSH